MTTQPRVLEKLTEEEKYLHAILSDDSGIDMAEFLFSDSMNKEDGCYRVYPYQWSWFREESSQVIAACARSVGKALALDTPILTLGGWKTMGEIETGDTVFDEQYQKCNVTLAHETMHDRPCYKIVFVRDDGLHETIVADEEHQWTLTNEYGKNETATTKQIFKWGTENYILYTKSNDGLESVFTIKSIIPTETVPVRCITVDSPNNLFLVGKTFIPTHNSESIMLEVAAFPYNYPDQEQVLVVPEGTQGLNLTTRIQAKFEGTRFMREVIPNIQSSGITQRPFTIKWGNGARFFVRLPQRDGRGLRGVHPVKLHIDEGQDLTTESYEETPEVVRTDIDGWKWKIYGVSKGIRGDFFWNACQPGSGWTVQQYTGMHRPGWNEEERESKIKSYSGYASPAYVRNVWGEPGDEANSIFVLANFMRCVDTREGSDYNTQEYFSKTITGDMIRNYTGVTDLAYSGDGDIDPRMVAIESMLQFPASHTSKYETFWMGMDVGLVSDPTEIMIAAEYELSGAEKSADRRAEIAVPDTGLTRFKLVGRVSLKEIPAPMQARIIMYMINHYKPKGFAMDSTGLGEPTFNILQELAGSSRFVTVQSDPDEDLLGAAKEALTVIKGYAFSSKIPVAIDEQEAAKLQGEPPSKILKEAGIYWNVTDRATEVLRQWVDTQRFLFPYDLQLIQDMNAQTFKLKSNKVDPWGRSNRSFSKGEFHILDGMRMMALAASQKPIEDFIASEKPKQREVIVPRVGFGAFG